MYFSHCSSTIRVDYNGCLIFKNLKYASNALLIRYKYFGYLNTKSNNNIDWDNNINIKIIIIKYNNKNFSQ